MNNNSNNSNNSNNIVINTRILDHHLVGVQRYTIELLSRFSGMINEIKPSCYLNGIRGHAWEQCILPTKLSGKTLWSPSNSGPLTVENQVLTLQDVVFLDHPEWLNSRYASWYRFLTPRLTMKVRNILTISEFSKERIIEHCPKAESKIHVAHLGVDSRFCHSGRESIDQMRKKLGIPSAHYLVTVGALEPRKNLPMLLKAWMAIVDKIPNDVWLVIAGAKGRQLTFGNISLENLPPRVHLTGYVPDDLLPMLYSGAIASPYLSLYEGFGLPPLEAMACGTPPITGNLASLPEVVGDAGIMVDPFDVEAIADGLLQLVENSALRSELSRKGLERVKQFTWDRTAKLTWQVLQNATKS